jgi:hypothetical protein
MPAGGTGEVLYSKPLCGKAPLDGDRMKSMSAKVLLAINCQLDESYDNRFVLSRLYADRFDDVVFCVAATCGRDNRFNTVTSDAVVSNENDPCICGWHWLMGRHSAMIHCYHHRFADIAKAAEGFDFLMFTEDDCLLSPRLNADEVAHRLNSQDAVMGPIRHFQPARDPWPWAHHVSGWSALMDARVHFDVQRLVSNWIHYSGQAAPSEPLPLFYAFCDFLMLRVEFLMQLQDDLCALRRVWHEAAIPIAALHNTHRIGRSNGLTLWNNDRFQPPDQLMAHLTVRDFVHPIKLRQCRPEHILQLYEAL